MKSLMMIVACCLILLKLSPSFLLIFVDLQKNVSHPVILSSLAWLFQPLKRTRQMEPRK